MFQTQIVGPGLHSIHLGCRLVQILLVHKSLLVTFDNTHYVGMTGSDYVLYSQIRVKLRQLLQISHAYILVECHLPAVGLLFPDKDSHHCALSRAVGCNQSGFVAFLYAE